MEMTENEKVIRKLYEITSQHEKGFAIQVQELLALGCERFGLDIGILSNIEGDVYKVLHQLSPEDVPLTDEAQFNLTETYCSLTLEAEGPLGIEHVAKSAMSSHPAYAAFQLESYIGIPLEVSGNIYGTLNFSSPFPRERTFSETDIDALKLMAIWLEGEISRQIFQRKVMQQAKLLEERNQTLLKMTRTDSLTQVGNRFSFFAELENQLMFAQRLKIPLSLVLFDLDDFKAYNDTYGHIAGDNALVEVASTIAGLARSTDYVARYGGEEFIVLLPDTNLQEAVFTAERFRLAIMQIDNLDREVSSSFGVSTFPPSNEKSIDYDELSERLIDEADKAMYHSKDAGKNCVNHYAKLGLALKQPPA